MTQRRITLFVGTARDGRKHQLEHRIPRHDFKFAWAGDAQLRGITDPIDIVYSGHNEGLSQVDVQRAIRMAKELNRLNEARGTTAV